MVQFEINCMNLRRVTRHNCNEVGTANVKVEDSSETRSFIEASFERRAGDINCYLEIPSHYLGKVEIDDVYVITIEKKKQ